MFGFRIAEYPNTILFFSNFCILCLTFNLIYFNSLQSNPIQCFNLTTFHKQMLDNRGERNENEVKTKNYNAAKFLHTFPTPTLILTN